MDICGIHSTQTAPDCHPWARRQYYWVDVSNPSVPLLNFVRLGKLAHRNQIAVICEQLGFKVGVELGVQRGIFAKNNLLHWPSNEKYYLIDVWACPL